MPKYLIQWYVGKETWDGRPITGDDLSGRIHTGLASILDMSTGATVYHATGSWRDGGDGKVIQEPSLVFSTFIDTRSPEVIARDIAGALARAFEQTAVGFSIIALVDLGFEGRGL
jgi:hypothetical protein